MKKIAYAAMTSLAALALSACGSSDKASEEAQAENVEVPAEDAMSAADATATPAADAMAPATDAAMGAATATPEASASAAAEAATTEAEKKM